MLQQNTCMIIRLSFSPWPLKDTYHYHLGWGGLGGYPAPLRRSGIHRDGPVSSYLHVFPWASTQGRIIQAYLPVQVLKRGHWVYPPHWYHLWSQPHLTDIRFSQGPPWNRPTNRHESSPLRRQCPSVKCSFLIAPDHSNAETSGIWTRAHWLGMANVSTSPLLRRCRELDGTRFIIDWVTRFSPAAGVPVFSTENIPLRTGSPFTLKLSE